jgi:hypothetical protein
MEPGYEASEDTWREFMSRLNRLKRRGVKRVWMVNSDAHRDIQGHIFITFQRWINGVSHLPMCWRGKTGR